MALFFMATILYGCFGKDKEWTLDRAIPRIETPVSQIACIGTTWVNGYHWQTTLYDKQGRMLETFVFGYSSYKTLNHYDGAKNTLTIHYNCSDSEPSGEMNVDTIRRTFDRAGKMVADKQTFTHFYTRSRQKTTGTVWRSFAYTTLGDTIITRQAYSNPKLDQYVKTQQTNIDWWEHDRSGRVERHYRLHVMGNAPSDTMDYYSQRFMYDSLGRRSLAWFDFMYLGQFYIPAGPDTVRYFYDKHNRLIREVRQYTIDRRNKVEIDMTKLDSFGRQSITDSKRRFFEGDSTYHRPNNEKTDIVEYRYEQFDSDKHIPLRVSQDLGY
ncbi:MAG: hypothetical protein JWP57_3423 [Spirosoma sp.]|nr:hypothetical protein [Spirosoma sp.]